MSILAALNRAKEQKLAEQEQELLDSPIQYPLDNYWKWINGKNNKDGLYIGNEGFKRSLQLIGLCDEMIEDLMFEDKKERENLLDYFNGRKSNY